MAPVPFCVQFGFSVGAWQGRTSARQARKRLHAAIDDVARQVYHQVIR
ncbi:hypothetical protein J2S03_000919 [Alicyclobacillus cycloheptanicus]|uniref:Uncharacterized protein n=1 Tax=Alicyclobacillus cycloheptanicus TaxID=1457 RepID=A0ABT9XFM5_9BACL|nr:hypothetical protein [Alicyclobacillus cycloheptanicus]